MAAMAARGVTPTELANRLKKKKQYISLILNGSRTGRLMVKDLAEALGVPVEYLTSGKPEPDWFRQILVKLPAEKLGGEPDQVVLDVVGDTITFAAASSQPLPALGPNPEVVELRALAKRLMDRVGELELELITLRSRSPSDPRAVPPDRSPGR